MGGFQIPTPDPNQNPYAIYGYPSGGFSPYNNGIDTSSQNWGVAIGANGQDVNPNASMEDIFSANRNQISNTGNMIGQEATNQLNYYSPIQQQMQTAQDQALNQLQQTPGFTPDEASQINVDYSQFNTTPGQYSAMAGDPNAPVSTLNSGVSGEGAMLNQYQSDLGGQLDQYGKNLGGATAQYGQDTRAALYSGVAPNVRGAVSGLGTGLDAAQGKFSGLNTAVNNPALGFDPNQTEKQLSDSDVQDIITASQTATGNQFRTAEDTLERQAAASGNTSPAAMAAMRQQLLTQEGSAAGDAATNAKIQALQTQYGRAASIEGQRVADVQQQAGMQATAATTEEAAAQAAAAQAGQASIASEEQLGQEALNVEAQANQQNINAANTLGQANLNATNQYGQFSTGEANTMTGQQYGAASTAEQLGAQRAAQIGQMQYQQGTGSQQLTSQGAQTVGGARIAGEGAYRSGVAQQQGMAQQGGQQAVQQQLGAYGTQTSGVNQAASSQAGFEVGKPSLGDTLGKGVAGLVTGHAEGAIVTKPEIAKIAEHEPELVVPIGRYRSQMKRDWLEEAA